MQIPLLIDDFIRRAARVYPNKTAVVDGDLRFSYREFQARVNQLSHAFLKQGLTPGDRVCMLSPNSHYFLESFYATSQIGLILVPLNYRLLAEDHHYVLNHSGVKVVMADYEYTDMLDEIRDRLIAVEVWLRAGGSGKPPQGWLDWDKLIANESKTIPPTIERSENDLVSINYTSGTTARPKGVKLTHRNCYINAYSLIAHLRVAHEDVELWTLPMFHCNGWGGVYALTGMGGTHVVIRTIDAAEIYRLIDTEGVTFACMAPAVLRTILDYPHKDKHQISTRPRFTVAGAPPPVEYIERLERDLGWQFLQIYGLTETAPFLTSSQTDSSTDESDYTKKSRAGIPGIGVEISILDDDGVPVTPDDKSVGEVCVRSNVVFEGYWLQDDETNKAIAGGFFHTGDMAVWNEHHNIKIVDRKKDVIISGGENISSLEIENVLYEHPNVLDCAVVGVSVEKWGESPKAFVVLRNKDMYDEREMFDFCRDRLAHFKCPTIIETANELPRTATGKLQKFRLREDRRT